MKAAELTPTQRARAAKATISTVRSLIQKGRLEKVTWFQADATGRKAYIYRPVKP